jgi:EAL and modified HD-GYP domain-containing signal transduction protein
MSTPFPLVSLQPVSDMRNGWVAMLLETRPAPDGESLARMFGEFNLGEALDGLSCIVTLPALPAGIDALPADRTILRMPAAFCCDRANDAALAALHAKGFRFMADGLPPGEGQPFAAVQSLAVPCPGVGTSPAAAAWLKKLSGPHLALGVEKVACPGRCHFQWLVGHVPEELKPAPKAKGGGDAPNRVLLLELLAKVANDADSQEIQAIVKRDPQLSYHLLKLVNSVAFSLSNKITSFNQAITLLGRRQLQRWLQLLLYARAGKGDLANPLLPRAALRAGLAEALCRAGGASRDAQDRAFMAGMFSLLDALFGMPLAEIMKPLNLADDVVAALTDRSGPLGALLAAVEAGEKPVGDELAARLAAAGIGHENWARCLIEACRWAIQVSREA